MSGRQKHVVDLCGDSPPRKSDSEHGESNRRHKRRRFDAPPSRLVVELSDGEEDEDLLLARRLQDAERSRVRADVDADVRLARRLQAEEQERVGSPPRLGGLYGHGPGGSLGLPHAAFGVHGGRWDWLGSLARRPGDDWPGAFASGFASQQQQQHPFGGPFGRGHMPAAHHRRPGGGGQFGHLEFMDRDFNEADYEMLLRLDEKSGADERKKLRANSKLLDQLPSRRFSKSDAKSGEATCAICLENLRANQLVLRLPCKHEYHKPCILKWLKSCDAPSCPTCKAPVLQPRGTFAAPDASIGGGVAASTADADDDDGSEEWWHT